MHERLQNSEFKASFHAAFQRFWDWMREERLARHEVVFKPFDGNPRRVTRITPDRIYLVETTDRGSSSQCTRMELRKDFAKLLNDEEWRSKTLPQVRKEHGITNLLEFKRDMFERFESQFLQAPSRTLS